jgi:hypothetical protein
MNAPVTPIDTDQALCIAVGASPRAEMDHRPLAQRLATAMREWIAAHRADAGDGTLVLTVTDLWLSGDAELCERPCVAIGESNTNAAVAQFTLGLPQSTVVDGQYEIRMDPQLDDLRVCIRGTHAAGTASGVDAFISRHLDAWMRAAHGM